MPGDVVLVPLNRREEVGVVWDAPATREVKCPGARAVRPEPELRFACAESGCGAMGLEPEAAIPEHRLKPLIAIIDTPPMRSDLRRLVDWMAAYTLSPPGEVMAMALRVIRGHRGPAHGWRRADPLPELRMTEARRRVLDTLAQAEPRGARELAREAGVSVAVIRAMANAGLLVDEALPVAAPFARPDPHYPGPSLSPDQDHAAAALRGAVAARAFSVTLLDGVTGSGKTEVYLEAVARVPAAGSPGAGAAAGNRPVAQWLDALRARASAWRPAVWHSDLTSRTRRVTWQAVAEGQARSWSARARRCSCRSPISA